MVIKYECYNSWNAFNSFILWLYKVYVLFVRRLGKYSKMSIVLFFQSMAKFLCNSMQFRLHVESFKLDMINLACGVIQISIKCSCIKIFDQQESFKLDMIDLACGVIRISNNILALRYSINKVIRSILSLGLISISTPLRFMMKSRGQTLKIKLWKASFRQ